jgi:threonine synthase
VVDVCSITSIYFQVGTSGDTGPSALEAVRGMEEVIDCVVLYPLGRVSRVQEGQMLYCDATMCNARVIGVEGTSDELDVPCETVLKNKDFKTTHCLGTVNSVNIVRMLVQTVHYFYGYLSINPSLEDRVSFSVPSGAAGHMCAGVLAKLMGLPYHNLLVATNTNSVLDVMISTGKLGRAPAAHTLRFKCRNLSFLFLTLYY